MALARVDLTSEVFRVCATHALTTEVEEVMGLLLGDVLYDDHGSAIARVWFAVPQIRTDRRKDRVEASPEQLARASAVAEQCSEASGRRTRVIGWYHSHPHITVRPSHVDVRTQAMLQGLDDGFIGLIFSVFNQGEDKSQRVQLTAFQAGRPGWQSPQHRGSWDFDMAAAITASMADAQLNASSDGAWVERAVPLAVVPPAAGADEAGLGGLARLCRVLFEEEREALAQAAAAAADARGAVDPLTAVHQAAEYQQHLARLVELVLAPALQAAQAARAQALLQQQQLHDTRDRLAHRAAAQAHGGGGAMPPLPPHLQPLAQPPAQLPAELPGQPQGAEQRWHAPAAAAPQAMQQLPLPSQQHPPPQQPAAQQQHAAPPPPPPSQPTQPQQQQQQQQHLPQPAAAAPTQAAQAGQASGQPVLVTVHGGYYGDAPGTAEAPEAAPPSHAAGASTVAWPQASAWAAAPPAGSKAAVSSHPLSPEAAASPPVGAAAPGPPPQQQQQQQQRLASSRASSTHSLQGAQRPAPAWQGDPFHDLVASDMAAYSLKPREPRRPGP